MKTGPKQATRKRKATKAPPSKALSKKSLDPLPPIPKHPKVTQARIDAILAAIADSKSLVTACADNGITAATWYLACDEAPWLRFSTTRAREISGDKDAEEVLKIADDSSLTPEERRVRIDTRKWTAARKAPKRWGDKLELVGSIEVASGQAARDQAAALLAQAAELRARLRLVE